MFKNKITLTILVLLVIGLVGGIWYMESGSKKPANTNSNGTTGNSGAQQVSRLSIALHGGQPVSPPATYVVKTGTRLEFSITSDVFGKVQVPTNPVQTITFTKSPLVFQLTAGHPGTYPLGYLANGSKQAILIGTIDVRSS